VRVIMMAAVAALGSAACATDGDDADDRPLVISKVAIKDIPVSPGPMLSLGYPCFDIEIPEPYDCSITIRDADAVETVLPSCVLQPDARPCWKITTDAQNCLDAKHQRLEVARSSPPAYAHHLLAQCVSL
jgi:hypothetical protein